MSSTFLKWKTHKETEKYGPYAEKKKKQSREIVTKEDKTLVLLDKDYKSGIINMFK